MADKSKIFLVVSVENKTRKRKILHTEKYGLMQAEKHACIYMEQKLMKKFEEISKDNGEWCGESYRNLPECFRFIYENSVGSGSGLSDAWLDPPEIIEWLQPLLCRFCNKQIFIEQN